MRAPDATPEDLAAALSPSLFAEARVIVLDGAHEAGKDASAAVLDHAIAPGDAITVVVLHAGGARNKALADALRKAGAQVARCEKLRPDEAGRLRPLEVRRARGKITAEAVGALIEAVGTELRELAASAAQLVADTGGTVDVEAVHRYHRGRAEASGLRRGRQGHGRRPRGRARGAALGAGARRPAGAGRRRAGRRRPHPGQGRLRGPRRPEPAGRPARDAAVEDPQGPVAGPWLAPGRPGGGDRRWRPRSTPTSRAPRRTWTTRWSERCCGCARPGRPAADGDAAASPRGSDTPKPAPLAWSDAGLGLSGLWCARPAQAAVLTRLAIADLRLAAWFLWMTPLLAALSRACDARALQLGGLLGVARLGGLAEPADGGPDRRAHRLVALAALLVRLDPLDLGLDVRHANASSSSCRCTAR